MDADRTDEAIRRFEAVSMDYSDAATMYALAQIEFLADGTGETWAQAYTDSYAIYLKVDDAFYTLVKDLLDNPMEGSYLRELAETLNTELKVEHRLAGAALEELYTDIDPDAWYVVEVATAIAAGVMQGTSDTTFSPDDDTTRGQLVTMLYRMDGEPELEGNLGYPYEDVAPDTWYTDAVYWARDNGIVLGYSDTQFAPEDPITREQLAAMLYRYAAYKGYDVTDSGDLSGFADGDTVSGWAEKAMSWSVGAGLIQRDENGLTPAATATRAQTAAILVRLVEQQVG